MRTLMFALLAVACGVASAKLPPPDEAAKAKAAEAKAKADWQAKVSAYQLCEAQNRIAARVRGAGASTPASAEAVQTSAAPAGTPVAVATPAVAPCTDPGPFAGAPAQQKPLEASGAHSPAPTAATPPSVRAESAELAPAKR